MKQGIELMKELGFIDETDKHDSGAVRLFKKYDDEGFITGIINYFYSKTSGVEVFTNDLEYGGGIRLDEDLLFAVQLNFHELLKEKWENETKT